MKSQRAVTFPVDELDPLRYTVQNGNGSSRSSGSATPPAPPTEMPIREEDCTPTEGEEVGVFDSAVRAPSGEPEDPGRRQAEAEGVGCIAVAEEEGRKSHDSTEEEDGGGTPEGKGVGLVNGIAEESEKEEGEEAGVKKKENEQPMEVADPACANTNTNSTPDVPKLYNLFAISVSL